MSFFSRNKTILQKFMLQIKRNQKKSNEIISIKTNLISQMFAQSHQIDAIQ